MTRLQFLKLLTEEFKRLDKVLIVAPVTNVYNLKVLIKECEDSEFIKVVDITRQLDKAGDDLDAKCIKLKLTGKGLELIKAERNEITERHKFKLGQTQLILGILVLLFGVITFYFTNRDKFTSTDSNDFEKAIKDDTSHSVKIVVGSYNDNQKKISTILFNRLRDDLERFKFIHLYHYPSLLKNDTLRANTLMQEARVQLILFGDYDDGRQFNDSSRINYSFLLEDVLQDNYIKSVDKNYYSATTGINSITLENHELRNYKYILNHILSVVYFYSFEYKSAIPHLHIMNDIADDANSNNSLGDFYLKVGINDSAEYYLKRSIAKDSMFVLARENEIELCFKRGDWKKGIQKSFKYTRNFPTRHYGWSSIGTAYSFDKNDSSIYYFNRALQLMKGTKADDGWTTMYLNFGGSYYERYLRTKNTKFLDTADKYYDSSLKYAFNTETRLMPMEMKTYVYYELSDVERAFNMSKKCLQKGCKSKGVRDIYNYLRGNFER